MSTSFIQQSQRVLWAIQRFPIEQKLKIVKKDLQASNLKISQKELIH